jgi:hypothetical protein
MRWSSLRSRLPSGSSWRAIAAIITLAWLLALSPATAGLITFDELDPCLARPGCPDPGDPIPNGYQGLNWSLHATNATATLVPATARNVPSGPTSPGLLRDSGYPSAVLSGTNVTYPNNCCNGAESLGSFLCASLTLSSLYLGAAWRNDLNVEILGYSSGTLTHSYTAVVGVADPTFFSFGWSDLDTVVFHSFGGTNAGLSLNDGTHFVLDNLSLDASPVPAPASLPLLATGLCMMALLAWRKRRQGYRRVALV